MHSYRTHTCGALRAADTGKRVKLSGWVHRKRDHGGLLFIDLRDHYGLTQCVVLPSESVFRSLETVRVESVVTLTGDVVARDKDAANPNLPTGEVELRVREAAILSEAAELPLPVAGEPDYAEDIRLKHRYLDLRRPTLHRNIVLRSNIVASIRRRMVEAGFTEYQTPILTASSPEGARDFLVPSRIHPGKFYALPQAPQIFKQLIMMAGFDRYFQIAPCFRDEDARADRSPGEFYQLDVEMSFVTQDDVLGTIEPVIHGLFAEFADGRSIGASPYPRIAYRDALLQYGSDKPDLRIPFVCSDVSAYFTDPSVEFRAFRKVVEDGGVVRAIPAPGAATQPRSFFDRLNDWARTEMAAPGLGYVIFEAAEGGLAAKGPIGRFLPPEIARRMADHAGVGAGDALFFAAGKERDARLLAGAARGRIGRELGKIEDKAFRFCWVVDYPMYEWDEEEKRVVFSHNPFSMPQGGLAALDAGKPLDVLAYQYDLVCNGIEICSGAIRNHLPDIMVKAFAIAGYSRDEVEKRFGGMLNAFRYGAPPHGGLAPGLDRIVMLLAGAENIRDVVMFPMNQRAQDLMLNAPSEVSLKQLRELHIRLADAPKA